MKMMKNKDNITKKIWWNNICYHRCKITYKKKLKNKVKSFYKLKYGKKILKIFISMKIVKDKQEAECLNWYLFYKELRSNSWSDLNQKGLIKKIKWYSRGLRFTYWKLTRTRYQWIISLDLRLIFQLLKIFNL